MVGRATALYVLAIFLIVFAANEPTASSVPYARTFPVSSIPVPVAAAAISPVVVNVVKTIALTVAPTKVPGAERVKKYVSLLSGGIV
jgi:hypothetical protein